MVWINTQQLVELLFQLNLSTIYHNIKGNSYENTKKLDLRQKDVGYKS